MLEWTICLMNINVYVNINQKKKFNAIGLHSNRSQILTRKIDQGLNNELHRKQFIACAWAFLSWPSSISIEEKWHLHWINGKKPLLIHPLTYNNDIFTLRFIIIVRQSICNSRNYIPLLEDKSRNVIIIFFY
jgi:hypothetical protein